MFQTKLKLRTKVSLFSISFDLPVVKRTFLVHFQLHKTPNYVTHGISSRCLDGRHVLFLDYDNQSLINVTGEVEFLQKEFGLGHAFLFQTNKEGFHVIFLDKMNLIKAYNIMKETNCDSAFLNAVKYFKGRAWILRAVEKGKRSRPKFIGVLKSKSKNKISTAHKIFLQIHYKIPKLKYFAEDGIKIIPTIDYNTGNRVD